MSSKARIRQRARRRYAAQDREVRAVAREAIEARTRMTDKELADLIEAKHGRRYTAEELREARARLTEAGLLSFTDHGDGTTTARFPA